MMRIDVTPVLLVGGSGTRLWPLSREQYPKQVLRLSNTESLLQEAALRARGLGDARGGDDGAVVRLRPMLVACNEAHRFLVREQLDALGLDDFTVLLEPTGRNTAPALTGAALTVAGAGRDDVLLALPGDHFVADADAFRRVLARGCEVASGGGVVTFGVVPSAPRTEYGYIRAGEADASGVARVVEFVEKPDAATAREYLASGAYLWNAGIFAVRAGAWLGLMAALQPEMLEHCRRAIGDGRPDGRFFHLAREPFVACRADSIDYAVMEPLTRAAANDAAPPLASVEVIRLDVGWSDLGAWGAVLEAGRDGASSNLVQGDVFAHDVSGSLLMSTHRLVAAVGVRDLVVVETADAVLVAGRDAHQDVRAVTRWLSEQGREEAVRHRRVYRPWGSYELLASADRHQVKRLSIEPGEGLSLQLHHHRSEHWIVVRGTARVTRGDEQFQLTENESTHIPAGAVHRLENPGKIPLEVIEVQTGSYLGEDDIVRLEDRYDRIVP